MIAGCELRYDLHGRCAVRVSGRVLEPHVVAAPPDAPWVIEARCGSARGWLLAPSPPDRDAQTWLEHEVARRTAFARERQAYALAALDADLIERLTHRLRTDVMTLGAVAEGALEGVFADEVEAVTAELRRTSQDAQRWITAAREIMTVLAGRPGEPEEVAATLHAELEGAGRTATVTRPDEVAWTQIGGAGWAACARVLAADERLTEFTITPDEGGWRVIARGEGGRGEGGRGESPPPAAGPGSLPAERGEAPPRDAAGRAAPDPADLSRARHFVVAAGGFAAATDGPVVTLVLPAAVP